MHAWFENMLNADNYWKETFHATNPIPTDISSQVNIEVLKHLDIIYIHYQKGIYQKFISV